jgi:hemerythrin family non-heme iron protein
MSFPIPSPFAWDVSFDIQSPTLNDQHKKLFDLINELDADRANAGKLGALLSYVLFHFATEEKMFAEVGWVEAASHKKVHDQFVEDAKKVTEVNDGVMHFIKNWLVTHIKVSDMKYATVLAGK